MAGRHARRAGDGPTHLVDSPAAQEARGSESGVDRPITSAATLRARIRPSRTLDLVLSGVRTLGENQLNMVPFARDADSWGWSAQAEDARLGPWRRDEERAHRRTRRAVTALPGASTSQLRSDSRQRGGSTSVAGTRRTARRATTASLVAVECSPPRISWRLGTLILSITVAGSGAALAAAAALTKRAHRPNGRGAASLLPPQRCGVLPGQIPCSWWAGVNVYSGYRDQFGAGQQVGPRVLRAIETLAADGATRYLVYVPELDTGPGGSISIGSRAVSDAHLIEAASYGRGIGTVAVLKPHLADPTGVSEGPRFVSSYSAVLEHYGAVATQMRAKVFVISTELTQIYRDPGAMNALIDAAGSSYHVPGGRIAVAINWDQLHEALSFPWLKRVRLIGIDGYWPVGPANGASDAAAVERQWRQPGLQADGRYESPGESVAALGAAGHEVVFSEIGYHQCHGAAADPSGQPDPNDSTSCGQAAHSPQEQRAATEAAYCYWTRWSRDHGNPSWFHGLWWWDWDLSTTPNVWDLRGAGGGAMGLVRSWNTGNGAGCQGEPA